MSTPFTRTVGEPGNESRLRVLERLYLDSLDEDVDRVLTRELLDECCRVLAMDRS